MDSSIPNAVRETLLRTLCILPIAAALAFSSTEGTYPQGTVLVSPAPGAQYVAPRTTILVRCTQPIVAQRGLDSALTVTGSLSGVHRGTVVISDRHNLVFKPARPFTWNETVTVEIRMAILQPGATTPLTESFSFRTSRRQAPRVTPFVNEISNPEPVGAGIAAPPIASPEGTDTLPSTFPAMTIVNSGDTSSGFLFLSNFPYLNTVAPYLMILRNNGSPVFYREMQSICFDFKIQPNGRLTYFDIGRSAYYEMDSSYAVVDSFRAGNGYQTDGHDLRILPDGHALLMAADPEIVDMSNIVAGGDTTATVIGLIIQELDNQKNVVFQWRSWDHYQITDATHETLTATTIDYVHGNALELDADGNIIVSCRHMDEITKIDRQTGDILWRWGGKHNEFTFVNDSIGFSHQHAIRRIANGDFTLFDNGNFHTPHFSRALEYKLDQVNRTAQLAWQYRNYPTTYGQAMGYVQRLPNGNTLIGWGATNPSVTEVRPDGTKIYELNLPSRVYSYRAYRLDWESDQLADVVPSGPAAEPIEASLDQNYPNPFNPQTVVSYQLPAASYVKLVVFDILGRQVATLVNGRKMAGTYEVQFDASSLSSGVYFYTLTAGHVVETRKMVVVK